MDLPHPEGPTCRMKTPSIVEICVFKSHLAQRSHDTMDTGKEGESRKVWLTKATVDPGATSKLSLRI